MERYQLRLYSKPLGTLFDEVTESAWAELKPHARSSGVDTFEAISQAIWQDLGKKIHRFDNCGSEIFCDECAIFQPLARGPESLERDPNLREDAERYQLFTSGSLLMLLDEVAALIAHAFEREERTVSLPVEAHLRLREAVRTALAPYVYYNTECGKHGLCLRAQERPLMDA